jgi:hypothetical protein
VRGNAGIAARAATRQVRDGDCRRLRAGRLDATDAEPGALVDRLDPAGHGRAVSQQFDVDAPDGPGVVEPDWRLECAPGILGKGDEGAGLIRLTGEPGEES